MENEVIIIYKTDTHHSYASRDIIGIATEFKEAVRICKQQAKKEHEKFDNACLFDLTNMQQTQCYKGEGDFQLETIQTDTLI